MRLIQHDADSGVGWRVCEWAWVGVLAGHSLTPRLLLRATAIKQLVMRLQQQQQLHASATASEIAPAISIIRRERDIPVGITMCGAALAEQSAALSKINTRCQRLNAPQTHPRVFFLPRVAALPYGLISMLFLFFFFRLANCASAR